jgi:hypothetical protein
VAGTGSVSIQPRARHNRTARRSTTCRFLDADVLGASPARALDPGLAALIGARSHAEQTASSISATVSTPEASANATNARTPSKYLAAVNSVS